MTKIKIILALLTLMSVRLFGQDAISDNLPDSIKKGIEEGKYKFVPVDKTAEYPGGLPKFYNYISRNLKYPKSAKKNKLNGKIFVEFVINRDGTIENESVRPVPISELGIPESMKSGILTDRECELEAIRLIKESGTWIPAQYKEKPVRQKLVININFKI